MLAVYSYILLLQFKFILFLLVFADCLQFIIAVPVMYMMIINCDDIPLWAVVQGTV